MASERTCGECRDCRWWRPCRSECLNEQSPVEGCGPRFGCVLFAAKPAPPVAAFKALHGSGADLGAIQRQVKEFPGNVSEVGDFTHVYSDW